MYWLAAHAVLFIILFIAVVGVVVGAIAAWRAYKRQQLINLAASSEFNNAEDLLLLNEAAGLLSRLVESSSDPYIEVSLGDLCQQAEDLTSKLEHRSARQIATRPSPQQPESRRSDP